ncbi:hypothetical protein LCGC14_1321180 [marine sediment metagenome]|uniref:Uncharacterized protein n=1 Tax=marine sediment metagenome TaxID=412755 RepID=A0A0F9NLW1_9ZZZZ
MKIRIETKTVQGNDLQPGDLFSFASEEHWLTVNDERDPNPVGEKVYIRTNAPALTPKEDANVTLVTFRYVNDEGKSPPWVGTKLHHESFHVDMDIDDDGHKVAAMFPNSNCPYCKGELTVTEPDELAIMEEAINPPLQGEPAPQGITKDINDVISD